MHEVQQDKDEKYAPIRKTKGQLNNAKNKGGPSF